MTDRKIIEALGGPGELAKKLCFTHQRVHNWLVRGIPARVKLDYPEIFLPDRASSLGNYKAANNVYQVQQS